MLIELGVFFYFKKFFQNKNDNEFASNGDLPVGIGS